MTLNRELPAGLDSSLLDDFFAEADDHLAQIRQSLLQLETSGRSQHRRIIEELFHSFHSLKGISGLAGLSAAETVAHASEDYLRLLKGGHGPITKPRLELLMGVAQKMEQTIGAFHAGKPLPSNESLLSELKVQCAELSNSAEVPGPASGQVPDALMQTRVESARARGLRFWKCLFMPSQTLDAQGFNLASVRGDLSKAGEILSATPHIKAGGGVSFEFLVAATDLPAASAWEQKGVSVEPADLQGMFAVEETQGESGELHPFLAPSHMLRVHLQQLDELMRIAGEMVIHRSRLESQLAQLQGARLAAFQSVQETSNSLGRSLREMRESITRLRMVPVAELFSRMPFVVRDLARQTRKNVQLTFEGQETAIDKYLIEKLKDPLLHLVRNAFAHGVETPEERAAASKPEVAMIELKASTAGDAVIIKVRDDGRGIEPEAIVRRAGQLGIAVPERINDDLLLEILCASGFSTRQDADLAAGRGVGMTVVRDTIRQLGGQLTLETAPGKGSQFTVRLPLTLAVAETLLVSSAGQTCAVPQSFVTEILHTDESKVQRVNGVEVVPYRKGVLPVVRLSGLFQLQGKARYLLVITSERGSVGLLTEQVLGQKEVVVSALRDSLIRVPAVSGATELGDGKPVLILDGFALTSGNTRPVTADNLEPQLA